jgi:hypothetical protein
METGIQRTGLDLEPLFRGPLNVFGDSVAVRGSRKQRAEDEEVERALQQLYAGWHLLRPGHWSDSMPGTSA